MNVYRPRAYSSGPQWRRAAMINLGVMRYLSWWFFGVILVLAVAAVITYAALDTPQVSILQFGQHGGLWFPFSISVMLSTTVLQAWVANGGTRRAYIRGSVLGAVIIGFSFAVVFTLLLAGERTLYSALGWTHGAVEDETVPLIASSVWTHFSGLLMLYTTGTLAGLLVGVVYARYGGWVGTLSLPLTVGPILFVGAFLLHPSDQWRPWLAFPEDDRPSWARFFTHDFGWASAGLTILILAATAVAFHLVTRRIPIHSKEA